MAGHSETGAVPLALAAGLGLGETLQAVLGAWLVRRLLGEAPTLDSLKEVLVLTALAAPVSAAVSATIAAGVAALDSGASSLDAWGAAWRAEVVGVLVFAPLFLLAAGARRRALPPFAALRALEAAVLFVGLPACAVLLPGRDGSVGGAVLASLALLWATLRFGKSGTALALLIVALLLVRDARAGNAFLGAIGAPADARPLAAQAILGVAGLLFWALAAVQDDRRRALEEVRDNEARYRSLVELSPDAILILEDGLIRYCNPAGLALLGAASVEAVLGRALHEFLHPDELTASAVRIRAALETGVPVPPRPFRIQRLGGEAIDVEARGGPCLHQGRPAVQVVVRDITERRRAEDQVRRISAFREAIIQTAAEGICVCFPVAEYPHIRFSVWNDHMTGITGYTLEEINRLGWYQTMYPDPALQERARQRMARMRDGDDLRAEEWEITSKDGARHVVAISTSRVETEDGSQAVVALMQDVTERKQAAERLRLSLREKEALLKEIHHRVKNNLQIISSLLHLQALHLEDPADQAVFTESQNRVRAMALVHETLYGSANLGHIDVARYLDSLCAYLFRAYGSAARVALDLEVADLPLDLDRAIPCGLVVNELVSNALKYAFPGDRRGRVAVGLERRPDGTCALTVSDDGVGLPAGLDFRRAQTLGLQLVCGLTQQLAGAVEVDGADGTRFTITFRLAAP
jgi:PAS domain S-box-containing protein